MTINYPGAVMTRDYSHKYVTASARPTKIVLHSTEGPSLPDYGGGAVAPNLTVDLVSGVVHQHFPLDRASRALRHPSGTVETNNAGVVQIEMIGSCDPSNRIQPKMYALTPVQQANIARVLRTINHLTGIPLASTRKAWLPYPGSYGSARGQRLTPGEWTALHGVCGHQHVPVNDHGDPGAFPIAEVLRLAGAPQLAPPATTGVTKLIPEDGDWGPLSARVLGAFLHVTPVYPPGTGGTNTTAGVRAMQTWARTRVDGDWGNATTRAAQARLGVTQTGYWGPVTSRKMQGYLNRGLAARTFTY